MTEEKRREYNREYNKKYNSIHKDKRKGQRKSYYQEYYNRTKENKKEKRRMYYQKRERGNKELSRRRHFLSLYNLTFEQIDEILIQQSHKCLICGRNLEETKRCIDHDHKTKKVRGILCSKCNTGLHYIENVEFHIKAEEYLKNIKAI